MKSTIIFSIVLAALMAICAGGAYAQEMTKDQWQEEMNRYTALRNELDSKLKSLNEGNTALRAQSTKLDADITKCMDELYALVGSNAQLAAEYRKKIEAAENTASELMRLADADLVARSKDVDQLEMTVKGLWENKLSLIPEFWDRLTALNEKIKSLRATLAGAVKVYTVGTWSRDRDCLWNIAKKKDIYGNAWHWPKIWQGNRDQIKDPDIIHPGQKLQIPQSGEMTGAEKAAARSYYSKKAGQQ